MLKDKSHKYIVKLLRMGVYDNVGKYKLTYNIKHIYLVQ